MQLFHEYRGLKKEIYILFYGRIINSMGALIWPLMTLILKNKMGLSAEMIANYLLVMSIVQLPMTMIGGKLADHCNKKYVICCCQLVSVVSYFICGVLPLSDISIVLFFIAGVFSAVQYPSYDALVADLTTSEEREKAYSLSYLGMNLGLVLAPTIGGILFENHLNIAFLITALATLTSTMIIYFFVREIRREAKEDDPQNLYEVTESKASIWKVLLDRKLILFYILCTSVGGLVYSQFNFLIPLSFEHYFGVNGATYFGMLTSVNAFVVIVGTPLITKWFSHIKDISKCVVGEILIVFGLSVYFLIQKNLPIYFASMVIFTIGEIFMTIGSQPYVSRRIPATHRGRVSSTTFIFSSLFQATTQKGIGMIVDTYSYLAAWAMILGIGVCSICGYFILAVRDKKVFALLYNNKQQSI